MCTCAHRTESRHTRSAPALRCTADIAHGSARVPHTAQGYAKSANTHDCCHCHALPFAAAARAALCAASGCKTPTPLWTMHNSLHPASGPPLRTGLLLRARVLCTGPLLPALPLCTGLLLRAPPLPTGLLLCGRGAECGDHCGADCAADFAADCAADGGVDCGVDCAADCGARWRGIGSGQWVQSRVMQGQPCAQVPRVVKPCPPGRFTCASQKRTMCLIASRSARPPRP